MDIITKILSHVNFSSKFILAAMPLNSRAAGQTPRETNASGEEFPARRTCRKIFRQGVDCAAFLALVCECDSQYEGNPFREKYFCPTAKPREAFLTNCASGEEFPRSLSYADRAEKQKIRKLLPAQTKLTGLLRARNLLVAYG